MRQNSPATLPSVYALKNYMAITPDKRFFYNEIIEHTNLELMTKLTEYPSQAKQEAKIEAQRSNAEVRVLQKQPRT